MNNLLFVPQLLDRELTNDEIHIRCASLDQLISRFQRKPIKAIGDGLSCPLGGFNVSLVSGEPVSLF